MNALSVARCGYLRNPEMIRVITAFALMGLYWVLIEIPYYFQGYLGIAEKAGYVISSVPPGEGLGFHRISYIDNLTYAFGVFPIYEILIFCSVLACSGIPNSRKFIYYSSKLLTIVAIISAFNMKLHVGIIMQVLE